MSNGDHQEPSGVDRVDEFVELFAAAQQKLYVYILSMIFDPTDAYDVLQDTNLALWQRFGDFESGTNFYAWASEVARYRVLRYRQHKWSRHQFREDSVLEDLAAQVAQQSEVDSAERLTALRECLAKLPAKDRDLVRGRYAPEGTLRALAKTLGRSENALSQALRRIRKQLADCVSRRMRVLGET